MAISDWFKRSRKEKVLGEDAELWPHDEDELDFELETTPEHRGALESNPHLDALESDIDIFESTTETVTCTEIPEGDGYAIATVDPAEAARVREQLPSLKNRQPFS